MLVGRSREVSRLAELADVMGDGMSGVLVIRGEVGVGKSALLSHFADGLPDYRVIRLAGVEPEQYLSFAGLHRLLLPFFGLIDRLPQPQRKALESAFGLSQALPANPLLLGLSVLTLLADAAHEAPLACVIDDAQWLDVDSLNVLAFVARRLHAEQIGMLFAIRTSSEPDVIDGSRNEVSALNGLPEMSIKGLEEADGIDLLIALSSGHIDLEVARRITRKAGGNLLVLTEVGRALADGAAESGLLVNDLLPVGQRLEAYFLANVRTLSTDSQRLLLIAAAISDDDPGLIWRTAEMVGIRSEAVLDAEALWLVDLHPEFRFRHPLIRSAIYFGASEEDRRSAHRQVALAIDKDHDPDLMAWHLAAAAIGYDQEVANSLERCANKARERGGFLAEADFLARSAALSPRRQERASRTLAAAYAAFKGGGFLRAEELLESGRPLFDEPLFEAQALRLSAKLISPLGRPGGRLIPMLMSAVTIFESIDSQLAKETMLEALNETHFQGGSGSAGCTPHDVGTAALRLLSVTSSGDETADLVATSTAKLYSSGYMSAVPDMKRAVEALAGYPETAQVVPSWRFLGSMLSQGLWDDRANRKWHEYIREVALRTGDFQALLEVLISSTMQAAARGELAEARIHLAELEDVVHAQGSFDSQYLLGVARCELFAWEGDEGTVRPTAAMMYAVADALEIKLHRSHADRALLVLEIGMGNYSAAFSTAAKACETDLVPHDNWSISALVEAGFRIGERHEAGIALEQLRARALASDTPWALGLLARLEALAASDKTAHRFYDDSIKMLERAGIPSELARAHLGFGEWLQGQHRTADSRQHLHVALRMFEEMGANGFANRARETLKTTGDRIQKRPAVPAHDLTPQEAQIARRAAVGATNREIAAEMFISRYTVDYHLRAVFRKLGISSRRELTQVVEIEAALVPARR